MDYSKHDIGGNLPFTGPDLALYVIIGTIILLTGLFLRRYRS